jgi:hypothetical protein
VSIWAGRQVAIKVIRPELAEDADFRARFAREVSAARKVSGIFTTPVVDADSGSAAGPAESGPARRLPAGPTGGSEARLAAHQRRGGDADPVPTGKADASTSASPGPAGGRTRAAWDRRVSVPVRHRPFRRGWLIAAAAVAVLASVGAGASLAGNIGHASGRASAGRGPTQAATASSIASRPADSAPATQPPGAASMATLGAYLSRSASVRPAIQSALDGVQNCSESPATGEATLQQAIKTRQDI